MRRRFFLFVLALCLVALALVPAQLVTVTFDQSVPIAAAQAEPNSDVAVCAAEVPPGYARCHARVRTDAKVLGKIPTREGAFPNAIGIGGGYDPTFLQSAYNLTSISASGGAGMTVAIVDAFDDPTAEGDLATYRSRWGLPPCTTANGCFRKVNQDGMSSHFRL
jgi:subtilase family serine protease